MGSFGWHLRPEVSIKVSVCIDRGGLILPDTGFHPFNEAD